MSDEKEQLEKLLESLKEDIRSWALIEGEQEGFSETQQKYIHWADSLTAVIKFVDKASPPNTDPKTGTILNELRVELLNLAKGKSSNNILKSDEKDSHSSRPDFKVLMVKARVYVAELYLREVGYTKESACKYIEDKLSDITFDLVGINSPLKANTIKNWEPELLYPITEAEKTTNKTQINEWKDFAQRYSPVPDPKNFADTLLNFNLGEQPQPLGPNPLV